MKQIRQTRIAYNDYRSSLANTTRLQAIAQVLASACQLPIRLKSARNIEALSVELSFKHVQAAFFFLVIRYL